MQDRPASIVDLKHIEDLKGVSRANGDIRIGACTSMSEIEADPLIRAAAPILAEAVGRVACPQIRNRASIGGNLCNASPAADSAIPLLLLDAEVEVATHTDSGATIRTVPIEEFFKGPGATVVAPGEIVTHLRFKPVPQGAFSAWDKFGTRPAMEIAVASVGVAVELGGGVISRARVGYGSVAPVPLRGKAAEAELLGMALSPEVINRCENAAREEIKPITDVRASQAYRRDVVAAMLRRILQRAASS